MKKVIFTQTVSNKDFFSFFVRINKKSISEKIISGSIVALFAFCFLGFIIPLGNVAEGKNILSNISISSICALVIWGMVRIGKTKKTETIDWEEALSSK